MVDLSSVSVFSCQDLRGPSKPLTPFFNFFYSSRSTARSLRPLPCHYLVNLTRTPQKLWRPWRTTSPSWSNRTRRQRRYEFEVVMLQHLLGVSVFFFNHLTTGKISGNSADVAKKEALITIGKEHLASCGVCQEL